MKKIFLLFVISFIVLDIFAEAAFYQNVGSNQYNKIVFDFGSVNEWKRADTEIDGVSYGSKYVTDTWKLKGAEGYVWKNNGSDISSMTLYYRVYKQGSTAPSFSTINIPWHSNVGGDNQRWAKDDYDIDLLSLVTSGGTWVMEFYYSAATNGTNCLNPIFWSNSGSNYKLTFTSYIIQSSSAGNWNTGSNWHGSSVPTSSYSVRISNNIDVDIAAETHSMLIGFGSVLSIEAEKSLTVNNTLTNNAGNSGLVLKSDATGNGSLIFSDSEVSGTVERYIGAYTTGQNDDWHLISSPVNTYTIGSSDFEPGVNDDFFAFDESSNMWLNQKVGTNDIDNFSNGEGYLVAYVSTSTKEFVETINYNDITFTNLSVGTGSGWHLLGNPFSSAIKWNDGNWNLSNIAGTAKVLDNSTGSYEDVAANGYIPSTNGFFIQADIGSNSITIPTNAQIHDPTNNYKTATSNLLVINVTNDANTFSDKNKVGIRQDASMDYDLEFDSHKLFGWETAPQLWTAMGSEIFSTNYLSPLQTSYSLPLNFHAGVNSTYHLNFDGISSFDANIEIVLEDVISNTLVELSTQNNYSFTATTNDISERFILQFNLINENNELVQEESIRILYYDNSVSIINTTGNEGRVSIFDLSGKEIFSNNLTGEKLNSFSVNLSSGVYLIKANAGTELNTTKIFIH